ncbi:hypothetical protein LEP48_11350 [Isoptericola sp. NEAU-Y5]|uniref:Uncharacterized protein n=1 Tax=Isoptericola luteus TaxID=2879484 RepID=A0ABS7ZJJ0_9MICO|nr:hypothetical protein [Isoptericola sp. NEAU-Y5]MCA5893945.1 hypothetical protein [Isoptericola sp. NEAU-Y5]
MPTTIILTEDTLTDTDVAHVLSMHPDQEVRYRVLVPADTERNLITSIIDHVGTGELREAWDEILGKEPTPAQATATAAEQLAGSLEALSAAGARADGTVTDDDPVPALRTVVAAHNAPGADDDDRVLDVVVVTYPHAVEDTFHSDWASRARADLKVPVLHLLAGTSAIVD